MPPIPTTYTNSRTKRALDLTLATAGLTIVLLIAPFIFLMNQFTSPGPNIFKQTRIGKNNRRFTLYKFRSMEIPKPQNLFDSSTVGASRISFAGKILRKTHIDELPQVFNVLIGNMSIVGPRPYIEEECLDLTNTVPGFQFRHQVKPGITGLAQVNYNHLNSGRDASDKLAIDLDYVNNGSLTLDLVILVRTIWHMLTTRGV